MDGIILEKLINSSELRQNIADNVKRDFALKFDAIDLKEFILRHSKIIK